MKIENCNCNINEKLILFYTGIKNIEFILCVPDGVKKDKTHLLRVRRWLNENPSSFEKFLKFMNIEIEKGEKESYQFAFSNLITVLRNMFVHGEIEKDRKILPLAILRFVFPKELNGCSVQSVDKGNQTFISDILDIVSDAKSENDETTEWFLGKCHDFIEPLNEILHLWSIRKPCELIEKICESIGLIPNLLGLNKEISIIDNINILLPKIC